MGMGKLSDGMGKQYFGCKDYFPEKRKGPSEDQIYLNRLETIRKVNKKDWIVT